MGDRPLWPGHKPTKLYVVIQAPRDKFRHMVGLVWFTHAESKADAVRQFYALCPGAEFVSKAATHTKPTAQLVVTGGNAIRV